MADKYYLAVGSDRTGPFELDELVAQPSLAADSLVWTQGMSEWARADTLSDVAVRLPPPRLPQRAPLPAAESISPQSAAPGTSFPPAEDFILCNPRLPRMAQLICVYGIMINPIMWLVDKLSCLGSMRETYESNAAVAELVLSLVWLPVSTCGSTFILVGAIKLRSLRRSGIRWFSIGVWIDVICWLVLITVALALGAYFSSEPTPPTSVVADAIVWLSFALGLVFLAFEIVFLVWLRRHRQHLPLT